MSIPPGFRKFPQPPKGPMTLEDHKECIDEMREDDTDILGESVLEALCHAAYPQLRQQNN